LAKIAKKLKYIEGIGNVPRGIAFRIDECSSNCLKSFTQSSPREKKVRKEMRLFLTYGLCGNLSGLRENPSFDKISMVI